MQDKTTLRQSSLIIDACEAFGYEIEPMLMLTKSHIKRIRKL